jgi:hypothetical protein
MSVVHFTGLLKMNKLFYSYVPGILVIQGLNLFYCWLFELMKWILGKCWFCAACPVHWWRRWWTTPYRTSCRPSSTPHTTCIYPFLIMLVFWQIFVKVISLRFSSKLYSIYVILISLKVYNLSLMSWNVKECWYLHGWLLWHL